MAKKMSAKRRKPTEKMVMHRQYLRALSERDAAERQIAQLLLDLDAAKLHRKNAENNYTAVSRTLDQKNERLDQLRSQLNETERQLTQAQRDNDAQTICINDMKEEIQELKNDSKETEARLEGVNEGLREAFEALGHGLRH